jgi:hypothetical protein
MSIYQNPYKVGCEACEENKKPCSKEHTPCFGHRDFDLDTDPSRQRQPVKRASALSTASASASTLSTW